MEKKFNQAIEDKTEELQEEIHKKLELKTAQIRFEYLMSDFSGENIQLMDFLNSGNLSVSLLWIKVYSIIAKLDILFNSDFDILLKLEEYKTHLKLFYQVNLSKLLPILEKYGSDPTLKFNSIEEEF